ncbi:MAG: hypothetical protein ACK5LK_10815, partial [Chthoniobacterales bacterium]
MAATAELSLERTAFYRDEKPVLTVQINEAPSEKSVLEIKVGDRNIQQLEARNGPNNFALPLNQFRSGKYPLGIKLLDQDGSEIASDSATIFVAKRPSPDALQNWLWMAGDGVSPDWRFYKEHGFDFASGPMLPHTTDNFAATLKWIQRNLSTALADGLLVTVRPNGGIYKREFNQFPPKGEDLDYANASRWSERYYNPFSPIIAEKQNEANRQFMGAVKDYPNVTIAWTDMELQDSLQKPNLNKEGAEKLAKELGFTEKEVGAPEYVAPHVISDNDKKYLLTKYIYQGGNGVHAGLKRMMEVVKEYRPDILTMTDPFRHVPMYDVYPFVDIIHTWTYTNPDPKYTIYIEQLRETCKPLKQIPLQSVTLLNYEGTIDVPELRAKE